MNFTKNKNFICPFVLCLVLGIIIYFDYFYFGNFLYDCGREYIVPEAITKGYVPIKDIFMSYLPLSYQINALLFKIFGAHIDTLRIAGVFSTLFCGVMIYFCAREFTDEIKSLQTALIISLTTFFSSSHLFNYVLGYSYAFSYGVCLMFLSVYFSIKYIKEEKFLYPAFFVYGICIALKLEFLFLIFAYIFLLFYKKAGFKKSVICALVAASPAVFSFGILFLSGFNFQDLFGYFNFLQDFMNSKILKYYNERVFISNPLGWAYLNLQNFTKLLKLFSISFLILYFPFKYNKKWLIGLFSAIIFVIYFGIAVYEKEFNVQPYFSFLCITTLFVLIYLLFEPFFTAPRPFSPGFKYSLPQKSALFIFLALVQLGLAFRFHLIYAGSHSTYILPIGMLFNILFFVKENKLIMQFLLILASINIFYFTLILNIVPSYPIEAPRGKMLIARKYEANVINKAISYINENVKKDDELLILPEAGLLGFVSNRKVNLKYHQLIPNHIEALGEENIVADLEKNPPDFIFIFNTDYTIYGTPVFCKDFGREICYFAYDNYNLEKTFREDKFELNIYKRN